MDLEEIRQDIVAFADNEQAVIIDKGEVIFERNHQVCSCRLLASAGDKVDVECNGSKMSYTKFLAEELGRLSIVAEALRQKRLDVDPYIDSQADFHDPLKTQAKKESALQILQNQFKEKILGETKLIFLTADAGVGKTALLRRLTRVLAEAYLSGEVPYLLFHIDTQGRSFVRLEEAVARDLGQLRISGVFYPGIVRLIRHGLIIIAIDGFDELLAEIGYGEAYSGLGGFLRQLEGRGVIIAAARSAYFQVENYTAQSRLLASLPDTQVTVHQMTLHNWTKKETVQFIKTFRPRSGNGIPNPQALYNELESLLGGDHVILTRPFLVTRVTEILSSRSQKVADLVKTFRASGVEVVKRVIHEFLRREVEEKWRDPNGEPYLTLDQHVHLLAVIAEEMWTEGINVLPVGVVEFIAELVVEGLKLPQVRRVQVVGRVKAHALLTQSTRSPGEMAFDHEEFLNYFLAVRIIEMLTKGEFQGVQRFCERHSLSPVIGTWIGTIGSWQSEEVRKIVTQLGQMTTSELRSTYLKQNAGLLTSQLVRRLGDEDMQGLSFDSMYFEGSEWSGSSLFRIEFRKCTFLGIDLSGSVWKECRFINCLVEGLAFDNDTTLHGCIFDEGCRVEGLLNTALENTMRVYVPEICREILEQRGAIFTEEKVAPVTPAPKPIPENTKAAINKFLRIFSRNSGAPEGLIKLKLGQHIHQFESVVLPELLKHAIVRETEYRGKGHQKRYELSYSVDSILKAEDASAPVPPNLISFWAELRT